MLGGKLTNEMGIPAIPRLIEALKESPPERKSLRRLRRRIIVSTKRIYEKAYTGHEHSSSSQESVGDRMRRRLLEMEIRRTFSPKRCSWQYG